MYQSRSGHIIVPVFCDEVALAFPRANAGAFASTCGNLSHAARPRPCNDFPARASNPASLSCSIEEM